MTTTPLRLVDPDSGPGASAGEVMAAGLDAARRLLNGVSRGLVRVDSSDLAHIAAGAAAVVAAAHAAQAAVVLESAERGVVATSDHPRVDRWVEQSCRDAGVPIARPQARALHEVAATCAGTGGPMLAQAVASGRLPVETAGVVAKIYRRLRTSIDFPNWDALLDELVTWAAEGSSARYLYRLQDRMIGQYGTTGALDEKHDREYLRRELTPFRHDRTGMLTATLRLDAASETGFTAAVHALSAPHLDEHGHPDPRTPGQRRADALLTLAGLATRPDRTIPGTGSKARVVVTTTLADLIAGDTDDSRDTSGDGDGAITPPVPGQGANSSAPGTLARTVRAILDGDTNALPSSGTIGGSSTGRTLSAVDGGSSAATPPWDADERSETTHIPHTSLGRAPDRTGSRRGYARTGFDQTLSPTETRLAACDAHIIPAVLGTAGELLDLGHAKRLITPGLQHALHLRDDGCTYPGCTMPPAWCDGHHITHWARGGRTDLTNLTLLCRHHHTVVHRHDHTATVHPDGTVRWTRHDGTPIGNTPRLGARTAGSET